MTIGPEAAAAILGMGIVTYGLRCSGLWVGRRVTLTERTERIARQLPPTLLVSIIAPMVVTGGAAHLVGTIATAIVAFKSRSVLAAMVVGMTVVVLVRAQSWVG